MSDIHFKCPHCQNPLVVNEVSAGLQFNCPHCSQPITDPSKSPRKASPLWLTATAIALLVCVGAVVFAVAAIRGKPTAKRADPNVQREVARRGGPVGEEPLQSDAKTSGTPAGSKSDQHTDSQPIPGKNQPTWARLILDDELWNGKSPWPGLMNLGRAVANLTGSVGEPASDLAFKEVVSASKLTVSKLTSRYGEGSRTTGTNARYGGGAKNTETQGTRTITYYRYGPLALGIQDGSQFIEIVVAPVDFYINGFTTRAREALTTPGTQAEPIPFLKEIVGTWRYSDTANDATDERWVFSIDGKLTCARKSWTIVDDRIIDDGLTHFRIRKLRDNFLDLVSGPLSDTKLVRGNDTPVTDFTGKWQDTEGHLKLVIGDPAPGRCDAEADFAADLKGSTQGGYLQRTPEGLTAHAIKDWLLKKVATDEITASPIPNGPEDDLARLKTLTLTRRAR